MRLTRPDATCLDQAGAGVRRGISKSLQDEMKARTSGLSGVRHAISASSFETPAHDGMVINEDLILEIVRPAR
jgi:hypothetical protein